MESKTLMFLVVMVLAVAVGKFLSLTADMNLGFSAMLTAMVEQVVKLIYPDEK